MRDYLSMLPSNCKNQADGIARAVRVEDMFNEGSLFFLAVKEDDGDGFGFTPLTTIKEVMKEMYDEEPVIAWNKKASKSTGFLLSFTEDNNIAVMIFNIVQDPSLKSYLANYMLGDDEMAKMCPIKKEAVLYLDCLECDKKQECKEGTLSESTSKGESV